MKNKDLEKRKLINLVIQGEAKNVKNIFHMPEIRDGLKDILGEENGQQAYQALIDLTTAADKKDWLVPYRDTIALMNSQSGGGLSYMEWE